MKDTTKKKSNMIKSKEENNWFLNFIYKDIDLEMHRESLEERLESLQDNFMRSKKGSAKKTIAKFFATKAAFAGSGASLFGLASLFGTASTGTAISTLSGAAFNNAALAWIGGSMAAGGAIVFGVSALAGVSSYFAFNSLWKKYVTGSERSLEDLDLIEKNIYESINKILVSIKTQKKQYEITYYFFWKHSILPLCNHIEKCIEEKYSDWPKRRLSSLQNSIKKLRKLSSKVDGRLSSKASFGISSFAAFLFKLFNDATKYSEEDLRVFEAIKRSTNDLSYVSTPDELGNYLRLYPDGPSKDGLLNNIKGIYHEHCVMHDENSDGDDWYIKLSEKTNEPEVDYWLVNTRTGERYPYQAKATSSNSSIDGHYEESEIPVVATSEIAENRVDVQDSGYTNAELTEQITSTTNKLNREGTLSLDVQETAAMGSVSFLITMSLMIGSSLKSENTSNVISKVAVKEGIKSAGITMVCASIFKIMF